MSGGRQTGTVPKTKHNSRGRRENAVNHIPNNLDWHEPYPQQRARKESNTCAFHLADNGEESWLDGSAWGGIAPSNRTDDDELRWSNVKSSNITPERGNVESYLGNRVVCQRQQENGGVEERDSPGTSKESMNRGRLKLKMEHSQRKIEELQHQQAALLTFRNKAIQQVKPVQMGEMQQAIPPLILRNKAIQHVKPVQVEMDRIANIEDRLQTMQDYSNFMQAFEREETSTNLEPVADNEQQIRNKLNELLVKKAQCDNILACIESDILPDGAASMSSEEGEASFARSHAGGEEEINRRDGPKQDNREHDPSAAAATFYSKELKLEEVKNKLEQLQTLLSRVERLRESKPPLRANNEAQPNHHSPEGHHQTKNCPPSADMEKLHTKKIDLEHYLRKVKSCQNQHSLMHTISQPATVDRWPPNYLNGAATANSVDYSSEEGDVEYDESPVKLCSSTLRPQNSFPKPRHSAPPNVSSVGISQSKSASGGADCETSRVPDSRCRPRMNGDEVMSPPNNTTLALQINQLQVQMEQMQMLYQNLFDKQVPNYPPPQPWLPPQTGFMQYMSAGPHWHQHQLLVNSLNQCCQLIWHQQRELAGLRQALAMLQEESSAYKCGGYGNNLNFDPGLLWAAQTSPQTLNNQVPPGNRANNYWDNFRSYSRQNLLSGRNKSNEGSIAESIPAPRPAAQTDNLRNRKDNSSSNNPVGNIHQSQREGVHNNCGRMRRRFNPASNLKHHDPSAVFSLEQSIYSELDIVIAETERDPQILLQLLTQLRNLRSQHPSPYEETNPPGFENDCELMDNPMQFPNLLPRIDEPRNDYEVSKLETTMMEVTRMIERQEVDTFMPQFLEQIVATVVRIFRLDPLQDLVSRLEASLLKFQGARISLVADELLCVIASLLTPIGPATSGPSRPTNNIGVVDQNVENAEEEGAVGGVPLLPTQPQHSTPQSVETELAEADQTQHNSTDNVEVFDIDEVGLPNIELDNQELPPREDNQEQPFQEP